MKKIKKHVVWCLLVAAVFVMPLSAVGSETINTASVTHAGTATSDEQPTVEWKNTYGGDECDHLICIEETIDGGYIACGVTEESDLFYIWLLKLDSTGNEEWSVVNHNLDGTYVESDNHDLWAYYVMQTSDGGYIISGYSRKKVNAHGSNVYAPIGYLWKVRAAGTTEWTTRTIYDEEDVWLTWNHCIIEVADGYIATGDRSYYDSTFQRIRTEGCLMKIDTTGDIEWYKFYEAGGEYNHLAAVCQTSDGSYLLTGSIESDATYDRALWMMKTDAEGNTQWESIFDGPAWDWSHTRYCFETDDGGYIMSGVTRSYGAGRDDVWVIKTDASGNLKWDKTFGGENRDYTYSMDATDDGGYIFGVVKDIQGISGTHDDIWIIKTDADGNTEWKFLIEDEGIQAAWTVQCTSDGGFIACGRTGNYGSSSSDGFVYKISTFENQRPDKPSKPEGTASGATGNEYAYTTSTTDADGDQIYLMWDWGDGNYSEWLGPNGSGETCEATHTWTVDGSYSVRVMAMDAHDGDSDWSDPLPVSMPKAYRPFWATLFETFWTLLEHLLCGT